MIMFSLGVQPRHAAVRIRIDAMVCLRALVAVSLAQQAAQAQTLPTPATDPSSLCFNSTTEAPRAVVAPVAGAFLAPFAADARAARIDALRDERFVGARIDLPQAAKHVEWSVLADGAWHSLREFASFEASKPTATLVTFRAAWGNPQQPGVARSDTTVLVRAVLQMPDGMVLHRCAQAARPGQRTTALAAATGGKP